MAATGAGVFSAHSFSPSSRNRIISNSSKPQVVASDKHRSEKSQADDKRQRLTLKHYFERSAELVRMSEGEPPRWFSPLDCGPTMEGAPVMFYLPGLTGVGLGLILHQHRLGEIFDMWCLHIPLTDRTPFKDLVKLVESSVRLEHSRVPNRPIYLVGESFGGCLALAVAARNPSIDLILILANPATSISQYPLQPLDLLPLTSVMPDQLPSSFFYITSILTGIPLKMVGATMEKRLPLERVIGEISEDSVALSSYISATSDVLTVKTLIWKLNLLKSGASFANSRLHAVKAQTLILASGRDQLLPSIEEAARLSKLLPNCETRTFDGSGHALFLDEDIDIVPILIGASFYRRRCRRDYVSDYAPPTPPEFQRIFKQQRWINVAVDPVMLSTLENGRIVRSLAGIPSEGPVLYVSNHMMLGFDLTPLVSRFLMERNILLRGIAHPLTFTKSKEGRLPPLSSYDTFRTMGAVPVSPINLYKLFSSRSHVLLYPGGMREALHRKGEEYKLFWPEKSEFVRMAAKFGAKIIPFGSVGEDDVGQLLFDYNDLMKIPYFKNAIKEITEEAVTVRNDTVGEVANQDIHLPIILPRLPGRFYYYFGKPIETQGMIEELQSRERAGEFYAQVKSQVETCLSYLKEKREKDPYRNLFTRLAYQAANGFEAEVPTFDL